MRAPRPHPGDSGWTAWPHSSQQVLPAQRFSEEDGRGRQPGWLPPSVFLCWVQRLQCVLRAGHRAFSPANRPRGLGVGTRCPAGSSLWLGLTFPPPPHARWLGSPSLKAPLDTTWGVRPWCCSWPRKAVPRCRSTAVPSPRGQATPSAVAPDGGGAEGTGRVWVHLGPSRQVRPQRSACATPIKSPPRPRGQTSWARDSLFSSS